MVKKLVIIILLLTLIIFPRILLGFENEKLAQETMNSGDYKRAAEEYELAAYRLFWRDDLWEKVGLMRSRMGQKEEAISALEIAKQENALSASGWDLLGVQLWDTNLHEEAFSIWQEGLQNYPDYVIFYKRLAIYYREKEDRVAEKEAIEHWFANRQVGDASAHLHYRFGLILMMDDPEKALDELTRAAHLDEDFAPVVETLRTSLNLALLESDPAEKQILLGRGLALVEEWQLAEMIFANATQAQSKNASAWAWLGEAKQHLDENPVPALNKAFNLNPDSTLVRSLRGLYWRRQGNYEKALEDTQALIKLEPENAHWYATLGEVYALSGDLPPALLAYQKAVELAPKDSLYWHLLALFSVQYGIQVEEVGLPAAQSAFDLNPKNANFSDTLGRIYFDLEQDENAEKEFLNALKLDPDLGAAHLHLGIYYLKYNHRNLAYQSLLRARELSQDSFIGKQAAGLLEEYFQE